MHTHQSYVEHGLVLAKEQQEVEKGLVVLVVVYWNIVHDELLKDLTLERPYKTLNIFT